MPTTNERYASLEVIGYSWKLVLSRFILLPLKWRRGLYKSYINSLSTMAFDMYSGHIVKALSFTKCNSSQFKNTEKELRSVLEWIPEFEKYRDVLRQHIREQRRKYKLKR